MGYSVMFETDEGLTVLKKKWTLGKMHRGKQRLHGTKVLGNTLLMASLECKQH